MLLDVLQNNPASTTAGIVGAFAGLIGASATLIVAFTVLLPMLRQVKQVHTIVNQQRTDQQNYNRALVNALVKAGIEVPEDQSLGGIDDQ
jgi:hypothetical protein